MRRRLVPLLVLLLAGALVSNPAAAAPAPVATIQIDGVISPVTVRLVEAALARAQSERAGALVILLDTPGGLERSMRLICQRLLNAEIPVIVYVAPTGARAASAGVFITMAAHVAAMAPATNIGAAHPVAVGGGVDKESMKKIENDAAAFARTIATERGRNAEWAERAVRQSVSITEREAVKLKVVDLIADSVPDLLEKIDGRGVKTAKGPVTLQTKGATVTAIEIGFRDRILNVITDPNVAYILMMLGMLGLFFELSNPGVVLPGVIGGIVAMSLGSLMLFDAPEVGFRVSWRVIVPTVGATAGMFLFVVAAGVRALTARSTVGAPAMVGQTGVARSPLSPEGQVLVQGELWRAVARGTPVEEGMRVRVVGVNGLTLTVEKAAEGGTA